MTLGRSADPQRPRDTTVRLRWSPSRLTRRLTTAGGLAAAVAAFAARPGLLVFAAPLLTALALWVRRPRAETLQVRLDLERPQTTEGLPVDLQAHVAADGPLGSLRVAARGEPQVALADHVLVALGPVADGEWSAAPTRWGHWVVGTVIAEATSVHRGWEARAVVQAPALTVYPPATAAARVPPPPHLRARLGPHVSRTSGAGVEFTGIRPYQAGDPVRRVNWTASSKADELMLNEYAQERMGDVVVLVDSIHDLGPAGASTVDVSVRSAAVVAQSYLAVADRVGVVAFGSALRWLTPTTGSRQFYRVVETLLQARQARTYVDPSVDRIPLAALPNGALVVCFSPLLDSVAVEAVRDLRERAHPVVVVDVLTERGVDVRGDEDQLALRIWRLERAAVRRSLERIGVRVVPHAELDDGSLHWLRPGQEPAQGPVQGRPGGVGGVG